MVEGEQHTSGQESYGKFKPAVNLKQLVLMIYRGRDSLHV